jgi:hypothetical protein
MGQRRSNPLVSQEIAHLHLQQVQVSPPESGGSQRHVKNDEVDCYADIN